MEYGIIITGGDKESKVVEIDNWQGGTMASLNNLNWWLNENGIYGGAYDVSTYIAGDFTASLDLAINYAQNYDPSQYNLLNCNCLTTTWNCVIQGKYNDGTPLSSVVPNYIGFRPRSNYGEIADWFCNTDFTHNDYWMTLNNKLWDAKQNYNNAPNQYWKDWFWSNIVMLSRLYH